MLASVQKMSLLGQGVVAIWQDLVPEAKQDFYEWHNRQHVPERLSIPGFRRGRRFIAVEGGPEFYTLYEADSVDVLAGKDYLERLNSPTDWTRRIMPAFRNMARSVCRVLHSHSIGEGGYMLTMRFDVPPDQRRALQDAALRIAQPVEALQGVVGLHLCLADEHASEVKTFEKTFRTAADITPQGVAMVEGTSRECVRRAGQALAAELSQFSDSPVDIAIYQVEHTLSNSHSGQKHRPAEYAAALA
jgi:hypothetical protein